MCLRLGTIFWGIRNQQEVQHLPNMLQSNKLEPSLTFQNNHGIFLGVNLDIPAQC